MNHRNPLTLHPPVHRTHSDATTSSESEGVLQHPFFRRRKLKHLLLFDVFPIASGIVVIACVPTLWPRTYDVAVLGLMWLFTMLGISVGYHRCFTHQAFKCGLVMKWIFGIAGSMAASGPVIAWVTTHRKHHSSSDKDGDPHSPQLSGHGWRAKLRGIFHAQIGWLAGNAFQNPTKYSRDLLEDATVVKINRAYMKATWAGILLPALGSQLIETGIAPFASCVLWGGFIRIVVVHQAISSVNSICHCFGTRRYSTKDQSRNNGLLALPTAGEAWHNNHHRYPKSAFIGLQWWEIDLGGWLVTALQSAGLIWDVVDARRSLSTEARIVDAEPPRSL